MSAKKTQTQTQAQTAAPRTEQPRQAITLELVTRLAPTLGQAEKMSTAFGIGPIGEEEYNFAREETEELIGRHAETLKQSHVSETAVRIHLQRIVGSFVQSAHGAAQFYGSKASEARNLTTKLANDDRDEDSLGVSGFESKAARARNFAAQAGLTAFTLLAAATGAVHGYAEVTGEEWKPYVTPQAAPASITRRSAAAELDALS